MMDKISGLRAQAVIGNLIEELKKNGSWCGETHVQKATYFLTTMLQVPLEFDFILYKHGPYSFDLRSDLARMKANDTLITSSRDPYGPSFSVGSLWPVIEDLYPKTLKKYSEEIEFVATIIGVKRVIELERLATALYVTVQNPDKCSISDRASTLIDLKPHVSRQDAEAAVELLDELIDEAGQVRSA